MVYVFGGGGELGLSIHFGVMLGVILTLTTWGGEASFCLIGAKCDFDH